MERLTKESETMVPDYENISAAFLVKNRKLFVAQRGENDDPPLKWELPGGKLEEDEAYDDALIREFREEFDTDITVIQEIGSSETVYNDKALVLMFFLIECDHEKIKLKVHKGANFVTFAELKNLDLCEADRIFIENYEEEIKKYID